MRRLLAVIGALGLVALAVAVRARLTEPERGSASAPAVLACISELAEVCRRLDAEHDQLTVVIEDAGVTQARLVDLGPGGTGAGPEAPTGAATPIDGWLVPAPYVAMVDELRTAANRDPVLDSPGAVLARSPLVMAVWAERLSVLEEHCGGLTWSCVGELADGPWTVAGGQEGWGDVTVGFPPITDAAGLLGVAVATASYFGSPDFARNDFDDTTFGSWLGRLARSSTRSVPPGSTPVTELLTKGPAAIQIASALEAEAGPLVARSARPERVRVLYPSPMVTADLVLAPLVDAPGAPVLREILERPETGSMLAEAGWRVAGESDASGIDAGVALPEGDGAPRPGVLVALEAAWTRAR